MQAWLSAAAVLVTLWLVFVAALAQPTMAASPGQTVRPATDPTPGPGPTPTGTVFLPVVTSGHPAPQWFGVEAHRVITSGMPLSRLQEVGVSWIRLGSGQFSWRKLQPNQGDALLWDLMAPTEDELRALKAANVVPVANIVDSPRWATITETSCAAISATYLTDFAAFIGQLVERYHTPEFNIHDWEIGNEPDVDPAFHETDLGFGCWGDSSDPYFGGRGYGEMLKVVGPVVRGIDPSARIWLGGLLLDCNPADTGLCANPLPASFFRGVLEAGAAPWLDVVAYHAYPTYWPQRIDFDTALPSSGSWAVLGGRVLGKAAYLRSIMQDYGVDKALVLNETGLMCRSDGENPGPWCTPLSNDFLAMQADHLVRTFVRGIGGGVKGFAWYTLDWPGWRNSSLMEADYAPRPAYTAYVSLTALLGNGLYLGTADYGADIEAYAFRSNGSYVQALWARQDITTTVLVSATRLAAAWDRSGAVLPTLPAGASTSITVTFSPVYLVLNP